MNKSIRFNKELYAKLLEVQRYYESSYHIAVSFNWIVGHLLAVGVLNAPLLSKHLQVV